MQIKTKTLNKIERSIKTNVSIYSSLIFDRSGRKKKGFESTIKENVIINKNRILPPIREHTFLKSIGNISANLPHTKA